MNSKGNLTSKLMKVKSPTKTIPTTFLTHPVVVFFIKKLLKKQPQGFSRTLTRSAADVNETPKQPPLGGLTPAKDPIFKAIGLTCIKDLGEWKYYRHFDETVFFCVFFFVKMLKRIRKGIEKGCRMFDLLLFSDFFERRYMEKGYFCWL